MGNICLSVFDTKNGMEQQLKEAVGGERKMSELIAFLLQGRSSVLFACGCSSGAHIMLFFLLVFDF